jgi:hypothetical protein
VLVDEDLNWQSVPCSSLAYWFSGKGSQSARFEVALRLTVGVSWCQGPLWDLRPGIVSCRNVAVWGLRSCFCGSPSLAGGGEWSAVCDLRFAVWSLGGPSRTEPVAVLCCLIWESPGLEGRVPVFVSPRDGGIIPPP